MMAYAPINPKKLLAAKSVEEKTTHETILVILIFTANGFEDKKGSRLM